MVVSILKDLEKSWREIKKKHNLEDTGWCITLRFNGDKITIR